MDEKKQNFKITFWKKSKEEVLVSLLNKNKFRKKRIKRIIWRLFKSPAKGSAFVTIMQDTKLIGVSYVIKRMISYNNKNIICYELGEHHIDQNYRNKKILSNLIKMFISQNKKKIGLIISEPNTSALNIYKRLKFKVFNKQINRFLIYNSYKKNLYKKIDIKKISKDIYIKKTLSFRRLNKINKDYLQWIFSRPFINYSFYEFKYQNRNFIFAIRDTYNNKGTKSLESIKKKNSKISILSEAFVNKSKASLNEILLMVDMRNSYLKKYDRVIFNANTGGISKKKLTTLSVDFKNTYLVSMNLSNLIAKNINFGDYQLSDTDFG